MWWMSLAWALDPVAVQRADGEANFIDSTDVDYPTQLLGEDGAEYANVGPSVTCRVPGGDWVSGPGAGGSTSTDVRTGWVGGRYTVLVLSDALGVQRGTWRRQWPCTDARWTEGAEISHSVPFEPLELDDPEPFARGSDTLVDIDGQACAVGDDAIWCLDFAAPPATDVPVPIWHTAELVGEEIGVLPYLEQLGEASGVAPEDLELTYEFRDVTNTASGETFVIVRARFLNEGIDHVNVSWVARFDAVADGFERFAGPSIETALTNLSVLPSMLGEADTIDYDPV